MNHPSIFSIEDNIAKSFSYEKEIKIYSQKYVEEKSNIGCVWSLIDKIFVIWFGFCDVYSISLAF